MLTCPRGHRPGAGITWAVSMSLLALTALTGCTESAAVTADTWTVRRGTVTEVIQSVATITPKASATVTSPAVGHIGKLWVKDGDRVTKGQALMWIDCPNAADRLRLARKAYKDAQEAVEVASHVNLAYQDNSHSRDAQDLAKRLEIRDDRLNNLLTLDPFGRVMKFQKAEAAELEHFAKQADAAANEARANAALESQAELQVAYLKTQLAQAASELVFAERLADDLIIRSPIDGVVFLRGASGTIETDPDPARVVGQQAGADNKESDKKDEKNRKTDDESQSPLFEGFPVSTNTPVAKVTDSSELSATAEVDEADVLQVKPGLPVDVRLSTVPDASFAATVTGVDAKPTSAARGGASYWVRLAFTSQTWPEGFVGQPRAGMDAVARFQLRTVDDAVVVPTSALVRSGRHSSHTTVWVITNKHAHQREVKVGIEGETAAEILAGLKPGDIVVQRGVKEMSEGLKVA